MFYKSIKHLGLLATLFVMVAALSMVSAQRTQVIWFVGLGTGTNPEQIAAQERVVEAFNAAHPDIELVLNIGASYETSRDTLQTLLAAGNAPDIIGPVGTAGANAFAGSWLDLQPLVDAAGYDLSQFPDAAVDFYRTDEGLVGLPLATFPSFIYFNRELFDEAGIPYPPQEYGAPYVDVNGEEREWNWDTLAEVAMMLTVDANGEDATSPDFNPDSIVQFGFVHQWNDARNFMSAFGSGAAFDPETGSAVMPESWRQSIAWMYDGIWNRHFIPNSAYESSELLQGGGGAFSSGNVAMARTHLWYTCCLGDFRSWDIAVVPAGPDGNYTSTLHADTFRVLNTTRNPEATFTALSYLVGEASLELLAVYGGMPAREADRETFFNTLDGRYPQNVNWAVVEASLNYPDIPSHEAYMPNNNKAFERLGAFQTLLVSTPDLDLNAEIEKLIAELQAIYDEVQ